jgi:hypothetical protein
MEGNPSTRNARGKKLTGKKDHQESDPHDLTRDENNLAGCRS